MLLAVDIGTSQTKCIIFTDRASSPVCKIENKQLADSPKNLSSLTAQLQSIGYSLSSITDIFVSSVAPELNEVMEKSLKNLTGIKPYILTHEDFPFEIKVDK